MPNLDNVTAYKGLAEPARGAAAVGTTRGSYVKGS